MLQVCITGANASEVINRVRPLIDPTQFSLSLEPDNCQAELIFGSTPAQGDAPIKKIYFQRLDERQPLQREVKIWPDSQELADQLLLTTIHGIWLEHRYHEANQAKLNAEARLKAALINNSDILTLLDSSGKVMFQSTSINQKMGYGENELEGKSLFEIIHPDDLPHVISAFGHAMQHDGVSQRLEFRLKDKNGTYIFLEAIGNNQLKNPHIQAFVVHSHDISDRKKEEQEKNKLIKELTRQNSDLKQFAYITTHNLRGPFTNIQALLPMIQANQVVQPDVHEALTQSVMMLESAIEDLIRILFIKEAEMIAIKPVNIKLLLSNLLNWLNPLIVETKAQIKIDIPEEAVVPFNESYLREILEQLIRNALGFRNPHRTAEIKISLKNEPGFWHLQVADNGLGFDYELVKNRVFGFYQRFHANSAGKGLGLFLAQTQAQACHAHLTCNSAVGIGSIFTLTIPESLNPSSI